MDSVVQNAREQISQTTSTEGLIVSIIIYALLVIAMWKIYEKAGEAGWKSVIPVLNLYMFFKIACGSGWKFILILIPFVNIFVTLIINWKLVKAFGKGLGMYILSLLSPPIALLIIGFGKSKYHGPQ